METDINISRNVLFGVGAPAGLFAIYTTVSVVGNAVRYFVSGSSKVAETSNDRNSEDFSEKKAKQSALASGYTKTKRYAEIVAVCSFACIFSLCLYKTVAYASSYPLWMSVFAFFSGLIFADFMSGLMHWALDTWGSTSTPAIGSFIRSFREHHVDPRAITRHDAIETNADNMMICVPFLFGVAWFDCRSPVLYFSLAFLTFASLMTALTNQFHSWAHEVNPPAFVRFLQSAHIVLPAREHQKHHHDPFDTSYTITTGWLNPVLEAISFWRRLEALIVSVTGAVPRKDDAFWRKCTVDDLAHHEDFGDPVSHVALMALGTCVVGAVAMSIFTGTLTFAL